MPTSRSPQNATILPGTTLRGGSSIGAGSTIGPMTTLIDSRWASAPSSSTPTSSVRGRERGDGRPLRLPPPRRPLGEGAKAGTFVEIKNSRIGAAPRCPISPTSATRTWESNLGATTVTANYDGRNKNRTKIGKNVHTGVDTAFVAPVQVGDEAYTGAGSVITEDVPLELLASLGRSRRTSRATQRRRRSRARARTLEHDRADPADDGDRPGLPQAADGLRLGAPPGEARLAHRHNLQVDLGDVTLKTFSNGEVYCRYEESIRGADTFIVQSTAANVTGG